MMFDLLCKQDPIYKMWCGQSLTVTVCMSDLDRTWHLRPGRCDSHTVLWPYGSHLVEMPHYHLWRQEQKAGEERTRDKTLWLPPYPCPCVALVHDGSLRFLLMGCNNADKPLHWHTDTQYPPNPKNSSLATHINHLSSLHSRFVVYRHCYTSSCCLCQWQRQTSQNNPKRQTINSSHLLLAVSLLNHLHPHSNTQSWL